MNEAVPVYTKVFSDESFHINVAHLPHMQDPSSFYSYLCKENSQDDKYNSVKLEIAITMTENKIFRQNANSIIHCYISYNPSTILMKWQ